MGKAIKDIGIFPETVEQMKLIKEKQAAIDPSCEKLIPEEFINWQPVGGITWEERAQLMNAKLRENGDILLTSTGSLGYLPGTIELSRIGGTFNWFIDFLKKSISLRDEYTEKCKTAGRTYNAFRDSSGNVFLEDIRDGGFGDGGFVSSIAFAAAEIPNMLADLQKALSKL